MFGDPCPGTHKYLEAHYQCLPGKLDPTHYCLFDKILLELQHASIKYTLFECYILISMSSFLHGWITRFTRFPSKIAPTLNNTPANSLTKRYASSISYKITMAHNFIEKKIQIRSDIFSTETRNRSGRALQMIYRNYSLKTFWQLL